MTEFGADLNRYREEARGVDPEVLDEIGYTHHPELAEAHRAAILELMGYPQSQVETAASHRLKADSLAPKRRRSGHGPQLGEEALPAPNQDLSAEQMEINRRGVQLARRALGAVSFDRLAAGSKNDPTMALALSRARFEKSNRQ